MRWVQFIIAALYLALNLSCERIPHRTIVVSGALSGQYKAIGQSVSAGATYAHTNLSALPDGTKLSIRFVDDKGNEDLAKQVALRAVADPAVIAVIGHSTSGTTGAAIEVYGPQSMPVLLPVATNPDLTMSAKQRGWLSIFRFVPSDDFQASKIAEFSNRVFSAHRVIVLNDESRYGSTLGNALARAFSDQRIEVPDQIFVDKFIPGRTDYGHLGVRIKQYMPDVVVFAGYYEEGGPLVKQLRAIGYQGPIILTDGCFPAPDLLAFGQSPGRVFVSFVAPDWRHVTNAADLLERIAQISPDGNVSYAPFAADALILLDQVARTILSRGQPLNRQTILSFLRENRSFSEGFIVGSYRFNNVGDNELGRNYLYRLEVPNNGKRRWEFVQ